MADGKGFLQLTFNRPPSLLHVSEGDQEGLFAQTAGSFHLVTETFTFFPNPFFF